VAARVVEERAVVMGEEAWEAEETGAGMAAEAKAVVKMVAEMAAEMAAVEKAATAAEEVVAERKVENTPPHRSCDDQPCLYSSPRVRSGTGHRRLTSHCCTTCTRPAHKRPTPAPRTWRSRLRPRVGLRTRRRSARRSRSRW